MKVEKRIFLYIKFSVHKMIVDYFTICFVFNRDPDAYTGILHASCQCEGEPRAAETDKKAILVR